MSTIAIEESLCFDHNLKVAANIGYLQEDRKWITEYDKLLLVLNNEPNSSLATHKDNYF